MRSAMGIILIVGGLITLAFGNRVIRNPGRLAAIASMNSTRARLVTSSLGVSAVWFGIALVVGD